MSNPPQLHKVVLWFAGCFLLPVTLTAQEPLAVRIDRLIEAQQTGPSSPLAGDAEFLRRLSLDLVGMTPTAAEVRAFLADATPNKRELTVNRYLADPRFALYWAELYDVMLMERRADKHIPHPEWLKYLQTAWQQNRPWDQLAREILTADGTDPVTRPAAKFFLDRDAEPNLMTRDVGRMFFGVDLQCAQCHDHPLVEHYAQSDYYGLFAAVNRTVAFNDEPNKKWLLGERADGLAEYKSVFTGDASRSRPRLIGGLELDEPHFRLGDEYIVPPADKVRPVAKHSRRTLLATQATNGQNAAFNRNIANRVWGFVFGRGLVYPPDMHHPHNPASYPEVLDLITQELVAAKFDVKSLVRQLVLTQAYQRSFDLPADPAARLALAAERLPAIETALGPVMAAVDAAKTAQTAAYEEAKTAQKATEEKDKAHRDAVQAAIAAQKPVTDARAALAKTQAAVSAKQGVITTLTDANTKAAEALKALPNDAEVKQAAEIFTKKVAAANAELAALQKTATDQTAAVDAAVVKWTAAVDAAEAAYAQLVEVSAPWEAAKAKWAALREQTLTAERTKQALTAQKTAWLQYTAYGAQQTAVQQAEQATTGAQTELAAAQQAIPPQEAEVAAKVAAVAEATKVLTAASQTLEAAKVDFTEKQTLAQTVNEAAAKTETALTALPNDAELTAALTALKSKQEPLAVAMKGAEQTLTTRTAEMQTATSQMTAVQQQKQAAEAELATRKQTVEQKTTSLRTAQAQLTSARGTLQSNWQDLAEAWANQSLCRAVKPLTPEQFAWSLMEACSIIDSYRNTAETEVEKTLTKEAAAKDPAQAAQRAFLVAQLTREKLRGTTAQFISLYASAGGQPQDIFFATADQALFVANGGNVRGWAQTLANRANLITEPRPMADEIYLSALSRPATDAEVNQVVAYLAARPNDRPVALQEIAWALLASAEFRFNH